MSTQNATSGRRGGAAVTTSVAREICKRLPQMLPRRLPTNSRFLAKSLENLAPRAGFEPATQRLTAACSTC